MRRSQTTEHTTDTDARCPLTGHRAIQETEIVFYRRVEARDQPKGLFHDIGLLLPAMVHVWASSSDGHLTFQVL